MRVIGGGMAAAIAAALLLDAGPASAACGDYLSPHRDGAMTSPHARGPADPAAPPCWRCGDHAPLSPAPLPPVPVFRTAGELLAAPPEPAPTNAAPPVFGHGERERPRSAAPVLPERPPRA